jgi:hypothetical protein
MAANPATQSSVLNSLGTAAHAAFQAYQAAQSANPGGDASQLYMQWMSASNLFSQAAQKAMTNDPAVGAAQASLDATTKTITDELKSIQNISSWVTIVGNLLTQAAAVAKFFV